MRWQSSEDGSLLRGNNILEVAMSVRRSLVLAIAALLSCAPATSSTNTGVGGSGSTLTAEQIAQTNLSDLYEVINRLRPNFLRMREHNSVDTTLTTASLYPTVYIDGQTLGDISSLHNIVASLVSEVRYYTPSQGAIKFGTQNRSGVIEVKMK
jgi:hypothetical protein